MNILIIGAAGMIGRKLACRLAGDGELSGTAIGRLTLYDVVAATAPPAAKVPVEVLTGDLPDPSEAPRLLASRPDVIFHLAAIVSGEAEREFDKGYRINLDGTRLLLEAIRAAGHMPRLILRTVEPAKALACQSVEKRCTRMKASRATSDMICSVNGTIACKPISRRIIEVRPSDSCRAGRTSSM